MEFSAVLNTDLVNTYYHRGCIQKQRDPNIFPPKRSVGHNVSARFIKTNFLPCLPSLLYKIEVSNRFCKAVGEGGSRISKIFTFHKLGQRNNLQNLVRNQGRTSFSCLS